ncbi:MAG TPA: histidine kinase [Gaiellaceae bacterium]|nr:histidine kinase [Gaiellaceae bacterium]
MDETERALLAERMLAEQEERRRVAELLHDGPIQQLSAIAQMLDAGLAELADGDTERASEVFARGLELARDAARDLRLLCDDLEPRVLHQVGFEPAVAALTRRLSARHDVGIDLDVSQAAHLGENAAVALYQILREAAEQAVRRGPPTRIEISLRATESGGVELVVADDGPPERRAAVLEALAERAATLNGRFSSEVRYPRGSTLRIEVPPAAAHR